MLPSTSSFFSDGSKSYSLRIIPSMPPKPPRPKPPPMPRPHAPDAVDVGRREPVVVLADDRVHQRLAAVGVLQALLRRLAQQRLGMHDLAVARVVLVGHAVLAAAAEAARPAAAEPHAA